MLSQRGPRGGSVIDASVRLFAPPGRDGERRLSVVVPTRNRARSLASVLAALLPQAKEVGAQVIVVDNGSTDGTESMVRALVEEHPGAECTVVREDVPGLLAARHRGAHVAEGELLLFADDDAIPRSGLLEAIIDALEDPSVLLATGRVDGLYEGEPPAWLRSFWWEHPDGLVCDALTLNDLGADRRRIDPNLVWGVCFAIRRTALVDFGGFHPDAYPDSLLRFRGDGETGLTDALRRAGHTAIYEPGARVQHLVPRARMRQEYFARRAYLAGISHSYTRSRAAGGAPVGDGWLGRARSVVAPFMGKDRPVLKARAALDHSRGYRFHQRALQNPAVRDWVTRTDYWDYRLPSESGGRHAEETATR